MNDAECVQMRERIVTTAEKKRRLEASARYEEVRRLAVVIWPTAVAVGFSLYSAEAMAARAWELAEGMHELLEERRPKDE